MVLEPQEKNNDYVLQTKRKFALIVAGIITLVIFISWLFYFTGKLGTTMSQTKEALGGLVADLKKNTEVPINGLSEAIGDLKLKAAAIESYLKNTNSEGLVSEDASDNLVK